MEKIARIMEIFWLVLAAITAAWAVYVLAMQGWANGRQWLLFPAVCFAMWGYRRYMRSRMTNWAGNDRTREGEDRNGR
ncbi:MAG: hypothetical protein ACOH13_08760 [Flavobacteriales bacterium]